MERARGPGRGNNRSFLEGRLRTWCPAVSTAWLTRFRGGTGRKQKGTPWGKAAITPEHNHMEVFICEKQQSRDPQTGLHNRHFTNTSARGQGWLSQANGTAGTSRRHLPSQPGPRGDVRCPKAASHPDMLPKSKLVSRKGKASISGPESAPQSFCWSSFTVIGSNAN